MNINRVFRPCEYIVGDPMGEKTKIKVEFFKCTACDASKEAMI